jgi:hypothetical protein
MFDAQQKLMVQSLEKVLIAFFVLVTLSLVVVYFADPSIYSQTLLLEPSPADKYPLPVTLFLFSILIFIAVVIIGVVRHWRWLFWLLLIAFGFSILQIPATILQLTGVIPDHLPLWYSLYRMSIAIIEVIIAVWMVRMYLQYGVWAMGRKKKVLAE